MNKSNKTFLKVVYKAIPSDILDETWANMNAQQQDELSTWLPARIDIEEIASYRHLQTGKTIIHLKNNDFYTVTAHTKDIDAKLAKAGINIID